MPRLLIATTNQGKIAEYCFLFKGLPFELVSPVDLGISGEVEEGHDSMEENARHKAVFYSRSSGLITVADDSGLEVDALGGEPGIHSARYAGEGASDKDRIVYLLSKLGGIPWEERTARFRCVIAMAIPEGIPEVCEGECEGIIAFEAKGENGFGYDPIFYLPEFDKTMAELTLETKNRISHRARAAEKAYRVLKEFVNKG